MNALKFWKEKNLIFIFNFWFKIEFSHQMSDSNRWNALVLCWITAQRAELRRGVEGGGGGGLYKRFHISVYL